MTRRQMYLRAGMVALVVGLVVGSIAEARSLRQHAEIGSILIEVTAGDPSGLVGLALLTNPGLEKTATYPLPKLAASDTRVTVPLFVMQAEVEEDDDDRDRGKRGSRRVVRKDLDTLLILTNGTTGTGENMTLRVTFRRADGTVVGTPVTATLAPGQTALISAADELNR
ncbi:MAG: hypothetical protein HY726_11725 [Candidatus Rokubacteria bacterium]|nr:hypothetical protein [Candidatus Rokubacteria bacterium]